MSPWTAWGLTCTTLCIAIGVACYATSSGLPLFALLLLPGLRVGDDCKCKGPSSAARDGTQEKK